MPHKDNSDQGVGRADKECAVSLVVVAYNMDRELPRTLASLAPPIQCGVEQLDYEIVVVDNGSARPLDFSALSPEIVKRLRYHRLDGASQSPVIAVNEGLRVARGQLVGVMIDGARLASPGLVIFAWRAARLHARPVIATVGFHIGPDVQMKSIHQGYNQAVEDRLLEESGWRHDGYNLFTISSLAGSSSGGWFRPIAESNALFMPAGMWHELGGMDSRFNSPGGGLVNLDTYCRACRLPNSQVVMLLGEATFHQVHGGIATNAPSPDRVKQFFAEYEAIRGQPFVVPQVTPIYVGSLPPQCVPWVAKSAAI